MTQTELLITELAQRTGLTIQDRHGYTVLAKDSIAVHVIEFELGATPPVDRNYHVRMLDAFAAAGHTLLQVFEDELVNKFPLILSRVKHALGQNTERVQARQCTVEVLTPAEGRGFLKDNHLAGAGSGAMLYVGLRHKDRIVAAASVGKARYTKSVTHELIRFATLAGLSVPGAASRLITLIRTTLGPSTTLVSYADRRFGSGATYEKIGFTRQSTAAPCYWYFKGDTRRHHRSKFQKHKLAAQLTTFDASLSEIDNMANNGWKRVFDSGNSVFILR
jgi:hypothetical protein